MQRRRLVLVGHGLKEDLQLLEDFGLEVKKVCRHTLDTQKLAARRTGNLQIGLKGLLEAVGIRPQRLHNAGGLQLRQGLSVVLVLLLLSARHAMAML